MDPKQSFHRVSRSICSNRTCYVAANPAVLKCKAGALTGVPQLHFGIDSKMQAGHSEMQTRHSQVRIDVQECFVCISKCPASISESIPTWRSRFSFPRPPHLQRGMIYKATEDLHRDIQATQYSNILLGDDAFKFEKNTKTIKSFRLPTQTTTIPLRKFTEFYGGPTDRRTDGGTDGRTDGRLGFPKA